MIFSKAEQKFLGWWATQPKTNISKNSEHTWDTLYIRNILIILIILWKFHISSQTRWSLAHWLLYPCKTHTIFLNFLKILHLCHPVWLPTYWNGRIFVKVLQGNAELDLILSSWRSKGPGNDRRKHIPTTKRVESRKIIIIFKNAGTGREIS